MVGLIIGLVSTVIEKVLPVIMEAVQDSFEKDSVEDSSFTSKDELADIARNAEDDIQEDTTWKTREGSQGHRHCHFRG